MNLCDVRIEVQKALDIIESQHGSLLQAQMLLRKALQAQMLLRKALITLEYAIDAENRGFRPGPPIT